MSLIQELKKSKKGSLFDSRIDYLRQKNRDTSIIQDGIRQVSENLLAGAKALSFMANPSQEKQSL